MIEPGEFYVELAAIAACAPAERYRLMSSMHHVTFDMYIKALNAITTAGAARTVPDGRSVKQVVGHIIEWERYTLISIGEVLAGVEVPGLVSHRRFIDTDGTEHFFQTVHDFNTFHLPKYAVLSWEETHAMAVYSATTLYRLFVESGLVTADVLNRTRMYEDYVLPTGARLLLPNGWYLWMITLEHIAAEHAADFAVGAEET